MFFEGYTEKLWGRHPSVISADWGSQRVKGISIMAVLKDAWNKLIGKEKKAGEGETSLIEEFWYPKYGPGQLWETVARHDEEFGAHIIKHAEVVRINETSDGRIDSVVYRDVDGNERTLAGDEFISSMPVKDLVDSIADGNQSAQPVPAKMKQIADGLPYRDFVTVGFLVDHLNLKNETDIPTLGNPPIVPDCWIYVQDTSVKVGRIQVFNNWSPYLVKDVDNKVWIGLEYFCNEAMTFGICLMPNALILLRMSL